tara:strand:+ start:769 stop:1461 length:693 start_codon:yes stop_codon:yes gene_type:complete
MSKQRAQLQIRITEDLLGALDRYLEKTDFSTRAAWYADTARKWLEWFETEAGPDWQPYKAPSRGEILNVSVPPEIKARLKGVSGGHMLMDIYWSVIAWFAKEHDLLTSHADETPAILAISLFEEQAKLIDAYIEDGTFKFKGDFWDASLLHWLEYRRQLDAPYEFYLAPPVRGTQKAHAQYTRSIYAWVKNWAHIEYVYPSTIAYNALSYFLDALENEPELARPHSPASE